MVPWAGVEPATFPLGGIQFFKKGRAKNKFKS